MTNSKHLVLLSDVSPRARALKKAREATRRHSAPVGLYASGFRDGHKAGALDAMRRLWPLLDTDARRAARAIALQYQMREEVA